MNDGCNKAGGVYAQGGSSGYTGVMGLSEQVLCGSKRVVYEDSPIWQCLKLSWDRRTGKLRSAQPIPGAVVDLEQETDGVRYVQIVNGRVVASFRSDEVAFVRKPEPEDPKLSVFRKSEG